MKPSVLVTFHSPDVDPFTFAVLEPTPQTLSRLNAYAVYAAKNKGKLWETASGSIYYFEIALLVAFLTEAGGLGPKEFVATEKVLEDFKDYVEVLKSDFDVTRDELEKFRVTMRDWRGQKLQAVSAPLDTVVMPLNILINRVYTFPDT